jgi:hypothetical protein
MTFKEYLKKANYTLAKKNPNHKPGHGYGPPEYYIYDIDEVYKFFIGNVKDAETDNNKAG